MIVGVSALVQQRSPQAWRTLNEACEIFHRVLDEQSQALFSPLFNVLSDYSWTKHLDLSVHLLQFFTKSSAAKLGCNHPISIVLYHLQERQILADAVRPVYEVLIHVSEESLEPTNQELWQIKVEYCNILIQRQDYTAAESRTLRSLEPCEEVFGWSHWRTRELLIELANLRRSQGLYELAEREYQDALQRGREDLRDEFPDGHCVCALRDLAFIWENRGDFAQCEDYWRKALVGWFRRRSMEDNFTTYMIAELEQSFRYPGKDPEAWLQQNFGISCV